MDYSYLTCRSVAFAITAQLPLQCNWVASFACCNTLVPSSCFHPDVRHYTIPFCALFPLPSVMSPTNKGKGPSGDTDLGPFLYRALDRATTSFPYHRIANIVTSLVIRNRFGKNISNFFRQSSTDAYSSAFQSW